VNLRRYGRLTGLALVGSISLTGCGTDDNTSTAQPGAAKPAGVECAAGTVSAGGSSAQGNAMEEWNSAYQGVCPDSTINYQPTGSGAGVNSFIQKQIAFAGSDSALKPEQQPKADTRCATGKAINIPMVVGPIAVAYKLDGVTDLQLKPATIAKIFSGKITKWNDAAIKADNPSATLPGTTIQAFHRSDESGTTDNFTKFLQTTAKADWPHEPNKAWPGEIKGGQGANGSSGVADAVKNGSGAISYMELSYAENAKLSTAKVANGAGEFVALTPQSAARTLSAAEIKGTGNDLALKIDYGTKAAGAYPIVLVTYEITCEKGLTPEELKLVKSFLTFTSSDAGQEKLTQLGYAPLPPDLLAKVRASVAALS
jgi:phosphate transport system substrate-binding protein